MIGVSNGHLKFEVMRGRQHIYTMKLTPVYSSEFELRGGRFEYFDRHPQEYKVPLRLDGTYEQCHRRLSELLNWIAEQADQPWSLDFDAEAVGKSVACFSFKSVTTAVAFKMVWF